MDSECLKAHIQLLKKTGGYEEICNSLHSNDLADIVRVAMRALEKYPTPSVAKAKSSEESKLHREQGNKYYLNGEQKQAILCYNKALASAPTKSLEMAMAYSNLSAVMLTIKSFLACRWNCRLGLELNCPQNLKEKLEKRLSEANKHRMQEMALDNLLQMDPFINNYVDFKVKRNSDIPCASDFVCVSNANGTKKVVAASDIRAGTMVAMEPAFVSTLTAKDQYTSCYYCHRMCMAFFPCANCQALFCSSHCQKQCHEVYHSIECQIVNHLGAIYDRPEVKLITRAAIKISLTLGWKEFRLASEQIGEERLRKSTDREAFDVNHPLSLLAYDDQKTVFPGKIFNGSIIFATIVSHLSTVPGYFPEDPEERKQALDAISRLMLHLYATYTNRIDILCSAFDIESKRYKCGVQKNVGWFSFTGKLAHSCEPNLFVLGLNNQVALVAMNRINNGEELTISYIDQFYDIQIFHKCINVRQSFIIAATRYLCECRVCLEQWDTNSHTPGTLTRHQRKAFDDLRNSNHATNFTAAAKCLDALTGLWNTTEHKAAYQSFRSGLNLCQLAKVLNKTYQSSSIHSL